MSKKTISQKRVPLSAFLVQFGVSVFLFFLAFVGWQLFFDCSGPTPAKAEMLVPGPGEVLECSPDAWVDPWPAHRVGYCMQDAQLCPTPFAIGYPVLQSCYVFENVEQAKAWPACDIRMGDWCITVLETLTIPAPYATFLPGVMR